jgi:hypothetical protein
VKNYSQTLLVANFVTVNITGDKDQFRCHSLLKECINIHEKKPTHGFCTQTLLTIIPLFGIIILIIWLYLIFVKDRLRPETILFVCALYCYL